MLNDQNSITEIEALLASKERELLLQREEVWNFVDTEHTSGDTKKYQALVRDSDIQIGTILSNLLAEKNVPEDFRVIARDLCQHCRDLHTYTRDMSKALADDLMDRRHVEDKKTIDVIKNVTFFFAVPGAFMAAVKNGVGNGAINVSQAAAAGVSVSVSVLSHKRIARAFKATKDIICHAPQQIRNSFVLYYVKEQIKESGAAVVRAMTLRKKLLNKPQA